ncbi:MAG: hypothetical protein NC926_10415 [Candidatus Omnitrophica bacterium]|nr:hypothetical protein [Candidatus Omnitrophota bacterium]
MFIKGSKNIVFEKIRASQRRLKNLVLYLLNEKLYVESYIFPNQEKIMLKINEINKNIDDLINLIKGG